MVASEFLDYLNKFKIASYIGVEDIFDQLNFLFSVMLLMLCAIVVTIKQYFMTPIACYFPVKPSGDGFSDFALNYCWVQGTYPIPVSTPD